MVVYRPVLRGRSPRTRRVKGRCYTGGSGLTLEDNISSSIIYDHHKTRGEFERLVRLAFDSYKYDHLWAYDDFAVSLLKAQSITGMANNGHGVFNSRFVNVTTIDVMRALEMDVDSALRYRQQECDKVRFFIDRVLKNPGSITSTVINGNPIMGLQQNISITLQDLGAFVYSVAADHPKWRQAVSDRLGFDMGYGVFYPVSIERLLHEDMTLYSLSSYPRSQDSIDDLLSKGVLFDRNHETSDDIVECYVRLQRGNGVSDDLFMIISGFKWGRTGYLLSVMADGLDTWSKYLPSCGGEDYENAIMEKILDFANGDSEKIGFTSEWDGDLGGPLELVDLIYAARRDPHSALRLHSSHSHLFRKRDNGSCAFLMHLSFINGGYLGSSVKLGFDRVPSDEFYSQASGRLGDLKELKLLPS